MPSAIEQIDHRIGHAGQFRLVFAEPLDDLPDVRQQFGAVELEVVRSQADVGAILLEDVSEPMGELDVAITGTLGVP